MTDYTDEQLRLAEGRRVHSDGPSTLADTQEDLPTVRELPLPAREPMLPLPCEVDVGAEAGPIARLDGQDAHGNYVDVPADMLHAAVILHSALRALELGDLRRAWELADGAARILAVSP